MRKSLLILLLIPAFVYGQSADDIIRRVDENENYRTQVFTATMTIHKEKRTLVKTFTGYGQKEGEKAFMSFTNNEDRGVKYLKLNNEMWIYFPDADDIMKISGHMLRQGMMGSDISYEDMLENSEFSKKYSSTLMDDQVINNVPCYVIDCRARVPDATYARQKLYIDKKQYTPLKIEMFAKGGRLIKSMVLDDFHNISGRWVPMKFTITDVRKRNSRTVMTFQEIKFDVALPREPFSRRNLRR